MGEWKISTWGEEISLEYGKALRDYENSNGNYRVYGSNGPIGWTINFLAPGPGIILGRKGAYRGVQYSRDPFYVIDTAYYVVPKTKLDMRWLYYAIIHYKLGEIDDGSPIPSTTRSAVYVSELEVPPFETQKAIAHILGTLDDKIEINRKMNETLEQMTQAIFKSWFVDFDPVKAKGRLAGKYDGEDMSQERAGKFLSQLDPEVVKLFPDEFEESELGLVPKGWEAKTANEISNVGIGKTPPRIEHQWFSESATDIPWISIRDLGVAGVFILHTAEFLTVEAIEKFRIRRIPDNTVVLSFKLTMGRVAITDGEMLSNEAIAHFKINPNISFGSNYLYCYLKGLNYDQLGSTSSIATAINSDMVRDILILVPPKSIVRVFETAIKSMLNQIKNLQHQLSTLATIRDTFLPKLMSGEIKI